MFNLFAKSQPQPTTEPESYPHYPGDVVAEDEDTSTMMDSGEYALECFDLF